MDLTRNLFVEMLTAALKAVETHKDELSTLDSATGDGDHGIAVCEALSAALNSIKPEAGFKEMLNEMGFGIMMATSGSMSTLMGALFLGMSDGVDKPELTPAETTAMFKSGLQNIRQQTKADIGDKTMMDALIPAVRALEANQDKGLAVMFEKAASAADEGRLATINMLAKFGRARNLGDRVIGHADAGASSITYIFKAFSNAITN